MSRRLWQKFSDGEIHFRDDWQFELKSEFSPSLKLDKNRYKQEFYLFIPNALQIKKGGYSRKEFYRDQTSLVRYKTPEFSFEELLDPENADSPLTRLHTKQVPIGNRDLELKLLGNVVRSQLRSRVRHIVDELNKPDHQVGEMSLSLVRDLKKIRAAYAALDSDSLPKAAYRYVGEFIDLSIRVYLMGILEDLRRDASGDFASADPLLCAFIQEVARDRFPIDGSEQEQEFILYRKGLLNKFVLDALLLSIDRRAVSEQYQNLTGMFAAAIAMFIYLFLFIWQGQIFVLNSIPFILITVVAYVLKDRCKEWIKELYQQRAAEWFPDFETKIRTPDGKNTLGTLSETFHFSSLENIPDEIIKARNEGFHTELEAFKRPETVLYFKREVALLQDPLKKVARRRELNTIFRFNVHNFLEKASNAWQSFPFLDEDGKTISRISLPKVYHLNIIVRNLYFNEESKRVVELQKFRCILDKQGIKRIDPID